MKTASVRQVPQKWPQILEWGAAGEEVEVTEQEKAIAKVVAATQPDLLARAKKIWGEQPPGKPLSELVADARVPARPLLTDLRSNSELESKL